MDDPLVSESDYDEEEYDIRDNIIAAIDDLEATYNDFVNKDVPTNPSDTYIIVVPRKLDNPTSII